MNRLAPYAAFFMRLAVGGVFLSRGLDRIQSGIPSVSFGTLVVLIVIAYGPSLTRLVATTPLTTPGFRVW